MKTALSWLVGLACLVGAWVIQQNLPNDNDWRNDFAVAGVIGQPVSDGRLIVTASDPIKTDEIFYVAEYDGDTRLSGNWVVIKLEFEPVLSELDQADFVALVIDGKQYRATDQIDAGLGTIDRVIGKPSHAYAAFELPADVVDSKAMLTIGHDFYVTMGDSYIQIPIDLASLPTAPMIGLTEDGVGQ